MEKYELTVIVSEKTTPAKVKSFGQKLEKLLTTLKGKITEEKNWGTLEFSYKIKKEGSGVYLHYVLELDKKTVSKLNESLRTDDLVIRHLLVSVEE
jgi:ribosomal protein S6